MRQWLQPWNKRLLLLVRKPVTNLDSLLKSRDITLPTKVHKVKTRIFLAVMCRYESWTIKKAEHWRIDAFKLWCWRKLFRVPWIARRSNQSILKEINPEYSLEGLMLKLELQYLCHLMWQAKLTGKDSDAEKDQGHEEGDRGEVFGWHHQLSGHEFEQTHGQYWWTGKPGMLQL